MVGRRSEEKEDPGMMKQTYKGVGKVFFGINYFLLLLLRTAQQTNTRSGVGKLLNWWGHNGF